MHNFVMRERQQKILAVGVNLAKGQLIVVETAMHRIVRQIRQRVTHPAHVPFHREPEAADINRPRHHRPGGGLLGQGQRAGKIPMHHDVQLAQQFDGIQVLAPAVLVRNPFARLARVIQVKHRGDGVNAQSVQMTLLEPEVRTG